MKRLIRLTGCLAILAGVVILPAPMAGAHGTEVCAFTSPTGLPAKVNNVEVKGGTWSIGADSWWDGSGGPDLDPMTAEDVDGWAHSGQIINTQGRRGLYYPTNDPDTSHRAVNGDPAGANFDSLNSFVGDHFNWRNQDDCNNNGAALDSRGVGIGYCGRSVGLGIATTAGHTGTNIIKWESFLTQLILLDPSARGTLNAQANPPGSANGSCLTGQATTFQLNGVITHQ